MLKSFEENQLNDSKVLTTEDAHGKSKRHSDTLYAILFLGPSLLLLSVFVFYPMLKTLYMSFFLTNNFGQTTVFVGLNNYISILKSGSFLSSLASTFVYVIGVMVLTIVMGLALAVFANQKLRGIQFFRTIFSSTMGVSVSVSAIFFLFVFNPTSGLLNQMAGLLHLPQLNWMTDPHLAMITVIVSTVWMNLGFTFLVLFGALQAVPQSLYDAANIEGASKPYQLFKITIPMISPSLFFVGIVTLIGAFKSFGLIDLMTAGGPNNATNLLVYRIYQDAFLNGNYSQASTESIILTIIIAIMTIIQFKVLEKRVNY
ncbi:sugar ABC transporter permease (plasmid) [Nicoliella spurrieriana]|uniref:Sugar ABC transporter permease n=1 Tax=Nicoliella spurrieriana TaxID=2925830 RepID=A0A976RQU7_9LACO|nr:sugar ABC transporter permease [Nicoliella spurrieriana]UQS86080.1 sugar ABC transporter permease [Nicoliella spurrieriana]